MRPESKSGTDSLLSSLGWSSLRTVSLFLYLVPGLVPLQALNTCVSFSWRLTNNESPPTTQHGKVIAAWAGIHSNHSTAAETRALPYLEAFQLWEAAGQCHLLVLFNSAAVFQQTHQTLNGVFESKSPAWSEKERKKPLFHFSSVREIPYNLGEEEISAMRVGKMIP